MKANELRIGNLIRWISTGEIDTVKDIFTAAVKHENINNVNISDCEPIPLAEEWLDRFGLREFVENSKRLYDGNLEYFVYCDKAGRFYFYSYIEQSGDSHYIKEIQYVHQLQNLYFALTGEELKIVEPC